MDELSRPRRRSFAAATHPGWWVIVGLAAAIGVLGALTTGAWAGASARRTAERLVEPERPGAERDGASASYDARTGTAATQRA